MCHPSGCLIARGAIQPAWTEVHASATMLASWWSTVRLETRTKEPNIYASVRVSNPYQESIEKATVLKRKYALLWNYMDIITIRLGFKTDAIALTDN
jgi:hypothetical protein